MFFRDKLRHGRNLSIFFRDKLRHGPMSQHVTEKNRMIWPFLSIRFSIDSIDSRTVDQDIQIFLQNVDMYPTK